MYKVLSVLLFVLFVTLGTTGVMAAPVQWRVEDGGNGHWYEAIAIPAGITWTDANATTEARGGGWHLATITSAAENAFVYSLVKGKPNFWRCCLSGNSGGPWLGGIYVGPGVGNYKWITGEPFVYTNWGSLEPFGNGKRIALFGYQASEGPFWNDIGPDRTDVVSYVIETELLLEDVRGVLENPPANSFQSGIGVVSGWKCSAGIITARFDGFIDVQASYGTARGDTRTVCNDDGNNGFGILVNWNNLGPGVHTVEILDNGRFFASATVTVTTFGTDFLSGASGTCTVTNFPSPGRNTILEWQQSSQNFAIRGVTGGGGGGLTQ